MNQNTELIIDLLKMYETSKRREGYIPTVQMLIEDLEEQLKKQNESTK